MDQLCVHAILSIQKPSQRRKVNNLYQDENFQCFKCNINKSGYSYFCMNCSNMFCLDCFDLIQNKINEYEKEASIEQFNSQNLPTLKSLLFEQTNQENNKFLIDQQVQAKKLTIKILKNDIKQISEKEENFKIIKNIILREQKQLEVLLKKQNNSLCLEQTSKEKYDLIKLQVKSKQQRLMILKNDLNNFLKTDKKFKKIQNMIELEQKQLDALKKEKQNLQIYNFKDDKEDEGCKNGKFENQEEFDGDDDQGDEKINQNYQKKEKKEKFQKEFKYKQDDQKKNIKKTENIQLSPKLIIQFGDADKYDKEELDDSQIKKILSQQKSVDQLFKEMKKDNKKLKGYSQEQLDKMKKMLKKVYKYFRQMKNYGKEEIKTHVKDLKQIKELSKKHQAEMLALIMSTMFQFSKNVARETQIISVLLFIQAPNKGLISQINTGEGKSMIVAILAAFYGLQQNKVDIITSSGVLASRDAKEFREFYNILSLTCESNFILEDCDIKKCYDQNIVYGSINSFQGDCLYDDFSSTDYRVNRKYDIVIVDEADVAMIDNFRQGTQLSSSFPLFEYFQLLFVIIWRELLTKNSQIYNFDGENYIVYTDQEKESGENHYQKLECEKQIFLQRYLEEFTLGILKKENDQQVKLEILKKENDEQLKNMDYSQLKNMDFSVHFPVHLQTFALSQYKNWVDSALKALFFFQYNVDYLIREDNGKNKIAVIHKDTGVIQVRMVHSNGLHQFLQIKHGLCYEAEGVTSAFISNIQYINKYQKIYGLTGTVGVKDDILFLKDMYNINVFKIPTFKIKQLFIYPETKCISLEQWENQILVSTQELIRMERSVLIINHTIEDTIKLEILIKRMDLQPNKITVYNRNDIQQTNIDEGFVKKKEVIISTNLAGRGTDIKIDKKLEEKGGLHVIVTFLPTNQRIQDQAYGRTARKGLPGTAEMIYFSESLSDTQKELNIRDIQYMKQIKFMKKDGLELQLKDKRFSELIKKLKFLDKEEKKSEIQDLKEQWAVQQIVDAKATDCKQMLNKVLDKQFFNPAQYIRVGYNEFYKEKKEESYEQLICVNMDKALNRDKIFCCFGYYWKAYIVIREKSNNYKERAQQYLNEIKDIIEKELIPQFGAICGCMVQMDEDNNFYNEWQRQIGRKQTILQIYLQNIIQSIEIFQNAKSNSSIQIKDCRQFKDVINQLIGEQKKGQDSNSNAIEDNYENEMNDFFTQGTLGLFYDVEEKKHVNWLEVISVFFLGIVQICVGAVLTVCGSANLGIGLMIEGFSDIYASVKGMITKEFDIKEWAIQKAISIAISVVTFGAGKLFQCLKGGSLSQLCTKIKQIPEALKTKVAKITAAGKQLFKQHNLRKAGLKTIKEEIGAQLIKQVAYIGLDEAGNLAGELLTDKHLKELIARECKSQLKENFFTDKEVNENIDLLIDEKINKKQQIHLKEIETATLDHIQKESSSNRIFETLRSLANSINSAIANQQKPKKGFILKGIAKLIDLGIDENTIKQLRQVSKDLKQQMYIFIRKEAKKVQTNNKNLQKFQSQTPENLRQKRREVSINLDSIAYVMSQVICSKISGTIGKNLGQFQNKAFNALNKHCIQKIHWVKQRHIDRNAVTQNAMLEHDLNKLEKGKPIRFDPKSDNFQLRGFQEQDNSLGNNIHTCALAISLQKKIVVVNEKGKVLQRYGEGEEITIVYKDGHYFNKGMIQNFSRKNNCLFDAIGQKTGFEGNHLREKAQYFLQQNPKLYFHLKYRQEIIQQSKKNLLLSGGSDEKITNFEQFFFDKHILNVDVSDPNYKKISKQLLNEKLELLFLDKDNKYFKQSDKITIMEGSLDTLIQKIDLKKDSFKKDEYQKDYGRVEIEGVSGYFIKNNQIYKFNDKMVRVEGNMIYEKDELVKFKVFHFKQCGWNKFDTVENKIDFPIDVYEKIKKENPNLAKEILQQNQNLIPKKPKEEQKVPTDSDFPSLKRK